MKTVKTMIQIIFIWEKHSKCISKNAQSLETWGNVVFLQNRRQPDKAQQNEKHQFIHIQKANKE